MRGLDDILIMTEFKGKLFYAKRFSSPEPSFVINFKKSGIRDYLNMRVEL